MKHKRCTGWWEQAGMGRQYMDGLMLSINGQQITGSGSDVIGMFSFEGELTESYEVSMIKQYLGAHPVLYIGQYNGRNRMAGYWRMPYDTGSWEIVFRQESMEKATLARQLEHVNLDVI